MVTALLAAATLAFGPPPAYANGKKLAQSSFCWGGKVPVCADFVPYRCGDRDVPTLRVVHGARITFRFGFTPASVSVGVAGRQIRLPALRTTTWRATRFGTLHVFATASQGDSSYVGCVRLNS